MKEMTALIRTAHGLTIRHFSDYPSQKSLITDLRGNGFKVLKVWNGYLTDAEVDEWNYFNRMR